MSYVEFIYLSVLSALGAHAWASMLLSRTHTDIIANIFNDIIVSRRKNLFSHVSPFKMNLSLNHQNYDCYLSTKIIMNKKMPVRDFSLPLYDR